MTVAAAEVNRVPSRQPVSVPIILAIAALAFLHGLTFVWYQHADWSTSWSDQRGYQSLGKALALTGRFTRYPDAAVYVPEVLRTPGYPMFVAAMYRLFGVNQLAVVIPQAALCAVIAVLVYALARRIVPESTARFSGFAVALYPPIPYFAALVMTEVWTTVMLTAAMALTLRAVQTERVRDYVLAGAMCAFTALCRPVFVLLPFALAGIGVLLALWQRQQPWRRWIAFIAAGAIVFSPWFAYNYHYFHQITISPAGGIGRATWEGSWQAVWPGETQAKLTDIADTSADRATLDRRVSTLAADLQRPVAPMLTYVHQWQDIRRIWTTPTESQERADARIDADREYGRVGVENIRANPIAWLTRRLTVGQFVLWAADLPIRYRDINTTPRKVVYAMWLTDAAIDVLALFGVVVLLRRVRVEAALLLATPLLYVAAVHFPLLTEARQSLPTKPIVVMLAVVAISAWRGRHELQIR
jgi:hypothetical protein